MMISRDLTESERLEGELRESQEYNRGLIESNIDALMITDPSGIITDVNRKMCTMTGYSRAALLGTPFTRYFTDEQRAEDGIRKVLAEDRVTNYELTMCSRDNRETVVAWSATTFRATDGKAKGVFAAVRDVRKQQVLEELLRKKNEELDAARRRLEHVVSSSPALLRLLKVEGGRLLPTWTSPNVERLLGFTVEEAMAPDWWETHVHPEDQEAALARQGALFMDGDLAEEYRFAHKSGDYRWVRAEMRLARNAAGGPLEVVSSWSDVTERKRADAYRATQHAVSRVLAESGSISEAAPSLVWTLRENFGWAFGALWQVEPAGDVIVCRAVNYDRGPGMADFVAETRRWTPALGVGLPGRVWSTGERIWIRDKGHDIDAVRATLAKSAGLHAACGFPIRKGDRVFGVLEFLSRDVQEIDDDLLDMMTDIGEQVGEFWRRTLELAATQERLRSVVASSPAVLYTLSVAGRTLSPVWVSDNIEQMAGYRPEEVTTARWWAERASPEERARLLAQGPELLHEGHAECEYRLRRKDGSYVWVRDEQRLLRDEAGGPLEVVGAWWVITDRKLAELRLADSEREYRLLFETHPQPLWVFDVETLAFLDVNEAAVRHYGYSRDEFLAMTIKDIRPPEEVPRLLESIGLDAGDGLLGAWSHRTKDGRTILVEIVSSSIVFKGRKARFTLANDITEKASLQAQLLQSQKMEAIGDLAGGVAHDFNNLLSVILGYATLLLKDIGSWHPGFKRVEQIRKAAERAADLTRQLLAFSRKQVLEPKVLDLNVVLTGVAPMLRRLIGEDVELVTSFGKDIGRVKADPGQLEQVLMNLVVNARDAMPQGGSLILETANADLDEAYTQSHPDVAPGAYVMLTATDSGVGMDAATMAHVFEPFFTTKPVGEGTGLGLATVFGILKQSGGHVEVYSEVGQGTTFKVYLPRVTSEAESAGPPRSVPAFSRSTETILLVEDADPVRLLIREILEESGYTVLTAPDPDYALNLAALHAGPIHLVLTDVVMPGMSGHQLTDRIQETRPEARVVYMSGYTDDAIGRYGTLEPGTHFLQKPFTDVALLQKLRTALGEPGS